MDADLIRRVEYLEEAVEPLRDLPDQTAKLEVRMGAVETQIVPGLGRDVAARLLESEGRTRVLIEEVIARIAAGREGSPPAI